jgi:nucleoside-diphosphate-sugar epimerase
MKKYFVTGSEGFIGSSLVEKLLEQKNFVFALVSYNSFGNIGWLRKILSKNKRLKVIFGDLKDPDTYSDFLSKSDYVINLASLISVPYSYSGPKSYLENNILGCHFLYSSCRNLKIKKIIHISSSEVYGTPKTLPITENTIYNPQSPYAASKAGADHVAKSYFYSFDLPIIILRPFNNFGPKQSLRAVIPTIINQALKGEEIKLGKVSTRRDFLYVSDTVEAILKTIGSNKNLFGEEINLGTNYTFKVNEVVNLVSSILKKKLVLKLNKEKLRPKASEVEILKCNYKKAKEKLNWRPKFMGKKGFKAALILTIDWYKLNSDNELLNSKNLNKSYK